MTEELIEYYSIPRDRIIETGVAHFDAHRREMPAAERRRLLAEMGLSPRAPYALFGMSSPYFAPKEIDIVEDLAMRVRSNEFGASLNLVIRPHPQNVEGYLADKSWLPRLRALAGSRVGVCWPRLLSSAMSWAMDESDLPALVSLLAGCSVNINSGSTLAIDGCWHNAPVILTLFDADQKIQWHRSVRRVKDYIHLKKLLASGNIQCATSFKELHSKLRQALLSPHDFIIGQRIALERECGEARGDASDRIACALSSMALGR